MLVTLFLSTFFIQLGLDNTLQCTTQWVSHMDGALLELARSKLLTISKERARGEYLSQVA